MITIHKYNARGLTELSWLKSFHSFSFADYYDPEFMGFGDLRVINEDTVQPGHGFGLHPHRDMEIITVVTSGSVEHQDSMGTKSVIHAGEVQSMSAGTGVRHSEMNPSKTDPLHLLQIWIHPDKKGLTPSYETKDFSSKYKAGQITLLVSPDGRNDSLTIHQDATISLLDLEAGQSFSISLSNDRMAWVQMVTGRTQLNAHLLTQGDGAAIEDEKELVFTAEENVELLLFDLANRKGKIN
jgi:quercetin 2,3-dioxygenase